MVSGDKAALESLRHGFEKSMKEHDLEEATVLKRSEAAVAKLEDAEEKVVDSRIKKIKRELPSKGNVKLAIIVALISDVLGLIVMVASYIPGVSFVAIIIGVSIDAVTLFLIIVLLGGIKPEMKWLLLEFSEAIPWAGALQGVWFGYSFAVRSFWKNNEAEYGEWTELMKSKTEMKGIFAGKKIDIGGVHVPQILTSSLTPVIIFIVILMVGCGTVSVAMPNLDGFNPVGVLAVNANPWAKAYKDSGRGEQWLDFSQVEFQTNLQNWNPVRSLWNYYNESVNKAGGNYYSTRIEETKDQELGLYIGDITTLAYNQKPYPARFSYSITGKTFTTTSVTAKTSCRLEKPGIINDGRIEGTSRPSSFTMRKDIPVYNIVSCNVTTEDIEPGFYQAVGSIEYPFEVWSYITYTFVSRSTFNSYQGQINDRLGIDPKTQSLSTNGPMVLAISQLQGFQVPQPYVVNQDDVTYLPVDFKLEDNANGKLKDLDYVIFQVPKEVSTTCFGQSGDILVNEKSTRDKLEEGIVGNSSFLDQFTLIEFNNFKDIDKIRPPISFRCSLEISKNDASSFLSGGAVTRKTFVATARYTYQIERRKTVEIKEAPTAP